MTQRVPGVPTFPLAAKDVTTCVRKGTARVGEIAITNRVLTKYEKNKSNFDMCMKWLLVVCCFISFDQHSHFIVSMGGKLDIFWLFA